MEFSICSSQKPHGSTELPEAGNDQHRDTAQSALAVISSKRSVRFQEKQPD